MYLHTKFHQDRTIFKEVRNLASRPFYIWRHSCHFKCHKLPILKWAHIQGKLKPIVKTPYLYQFWFWRSSPDKISTKNQNGCCGGHLGCRIKKMKKTPACIFMGHTLVKFGADSFTIQGDTECDRQTDGRTDGQRDKDVYFSQTIAFKNLLWKGCVHLLVSW